MSDNVVDARGMLCPQPLILTKKAIRNVASGTVLTVLIDNETSLNNVVQFLTDNGATVSTDETDGLFALSVTTGAGKELPNPDAEPYCTTGPRGAHAICFRRTTMGVGDDDLGALLAKAFINTIKEVEPLPGTIVFNNGGIFLALIDSPVREPLQELADRGVRILVCGTCLDFHGKKEEVGVGIVSNMYDILQSLTDADHVVMP